MIRGKTVFILGAGASFPYGFPLGTDLYDQIHNGEYQRLYKEFLDNTKLDEDKKNNFLEGANKLSFHLGHAANKSIDFFLSNNHSFLDRGKEAIALLMLKYEAESKIVKIAKENDWISFLFQECIENIRYAAEYPDAKERVSFITFNYDRSLEYFLHLKMINSFTEEPSFKLERILRKLEIYHVYGKIGELEWENEQRKKELGYGWDYKNIRLEAIRKDINVMYTERYGQKQAILEQLIENADRIFFLGFAYDPVNLHAIGFINEIELQSIGKEIYGTAIGMKDRKIEELNKLWGKNHKVALRKDMNCCQLLQEYLVE